VALSKSLRGVTRFDRLLQNAPCAVAWSFSFYLVVLAVATLAPPPISPSNGLFGTNLLPVMNSIGCFVPNPGQPSTTAFCVRTIAGNLAMFIPLGILLPLISWELASAKSVAVAAFALSVAIEALQFAGRWLGSPRWTDIDDVLFNVVGALIGYGLIRMVQAGASRRTPVAPPECERSRTTSSG